MRVLLIIQLDVQSLHNILEIKLIQPFLLAIVQLSYDVNFMFQTNSNEDSKKDKNDANELQRLSYGFDIP